MKTKLFFAAALTLVVAASCQRKADANWLTADDVPFAVDETFSPIVQELSETFALKHPEAKMIVHSVSEDSALIMLLNDSVRLCIATRGLSDDERDIVRSHNLEALQSPIATDAFALIVNKESPDTLITLDEIRGIVSGRITRWEQLAHSKRTGELKLLFDNSGSSTVRYMKDSLNGGKQISGNVFAQGNNEEVIKAVKADKDIIGVVGANWLNLEGDTALSTFANLDFKVMMVSRLSGDAEDFFRPYQYYIGTGEYPLLRTVYVVTTDPRTKSMVKNFYFFLKGDKGQRIICNHSQMLPYQPVMVRAVSVSD